METKQKKSALIGFIVFAALATMPVFGADELAETKDYIIGGATIAGLIAIVIINLLWIIFPAGAGYMSYSFFKRQAATSQEDNGIKASLAILGSVIAGFIAAFFIVGSIGKYAGDKDTLAEGNVYIVSSFLGAVVTNFKNSIGGGTTTNP